MSTARIEAQYVDATGAAAYTQNRHGLDGALLLDPVFTDYIASNSAGKEVLDAGCGAAPWAIFAAKAGALAVLGIDSSEEMLRQADQTLAEQPQAVREVITTQLGDILEISKADGSFDTALSINVGCALASVIPSEHGADSKPATPLFRHFQEMARVLKPGGVGLITAPASLETPFTTFGNEQEKITALEVDLVSLAGEDVNEMKRVVGSHTDILRATLIANGPKWRLVKQTGELTLGQTIQRKIPGLVVPNYNHPSEEYTLAMQLAGLKIREIASRLLPPHMYTPETGLGKQYTTDNPFDVYLVEAVS
jgi:SAM-dependent methyltransferase